MKKIILGVLALALVVTSFAQKPKKTHDAEKFVKKVQFSMTPELIGKWMPNAAALEYIAEKSGTPLAGLKAANEKNSIIIKQNAKDFVAHGLPYIIDEITVEVKQESPIKIANILAHCHTKDKKFILNLTNCVQTNISWYLGDGIVPEGDGFDAAVTAKSEKQNKKVGGLLGGMNDMNNSMKDAETKAQIQLAAQQMVTDSLNKYRPGYEAKSNTFKFDESKKNWPMTGYYVKKDGSVYNANIAYQLPEFLFGELAQGFDLFTYQSAGNSAADIWNVEKDPNFDKFIKKSQLKAYFLNGNLYKNHGFYGWGIVLNEGAIHSYLTVVKTEYKGKVSYQVFKRTQKLAGENGESYGAPLMPISEKNLLKMMEDAPHIIQDYKEGKLTLKQAEVEYNIWFDKQNPGKVDYHQDAQG